MNRFADEKTAAPDRSGRLPVGRCRRYHLPKSIMKGLMPPPPLDWL